VRVVSKKEKVAHGVAVLGSPGAFTLGDTKRISVGFQGPVSGQYTACCAASLLAEAQECAKAQLPPRVVVVVCRHGARPVEAVVVESPMGTPSPSCQ